MLLFSHRWAHVEYMHVSSTLVSVPSEQHIGLLGYRSRTQEKEFMFQSRNNFPWWRDLGSFLGSIPTFSRLFQPSIIFLERWEELDPWTISVIKEGYNIDF